MGGLGNQPPTSPVTILSALADTEQRSRREEQERTKKETLDALIKINGAIHSSAMIYNNAIILAGYAMFFGIWANTKQFLPLWAMQSAAISMGLSAIAFVAFEIYKMMEVQKLAFVFARTSKADTKAFASALKEYQHASDSMQTRLFCVQFPVLVFTLITGFGAALLLGVFFCINLLAA
jgi:hypothetical protein